MALEFVSQYLIFGKPLMFYLGVFTLALLILTATVGFLNFRGKGGIPFAWHPRLAAAAIISAAIHGALGVLAYF